MNQLTTITPTILAEARETVKARFGMADFKAVRVGAKKDTVRGELGVAMSGNKAERQQHADHIALTMWVQAKLGPLVAELRRVFPKLDAEIKSRNATVNQLLIERPEIADKLRLIRVDGPGKLDVMAMFALAQGMAGAEKGEKAKLLAAGRAINAFELEVQALAQELSQKALTTS